MSNNKGDIDFEIDGLEAFLKGFEEDEKIATTATDILPGLDDLFEDPAEGVQKAAGANGVFGFVPSEGKDDAFGGLKADDISAPIGNVYEEEEHIEIPGPADVIGAGQAGKATASEFSLPAKVSVWTKLRNVLFYEIKVELTPYQQKVEDEINEFLYQDITWKGVKKFLFQPITFGKGKKSVSE